MVIWITGLSGAGKTTISRALARLLKPQLPEVVLVDGDDVRELFGNDLSHAESDRVIQIGRLQRVASFLSKQGLISIVAALYSSDALLRWNRENLADYFEVLVDAPLDVVRSRDPKGIYRNAPLDRPANIVGLDIPWHRPKSPDFIVDVTLGETAEATAKRLIAACPRLSEAFARTTT